jgi:hypothetical protein
MGADSRPYARLRRALDAGQLPQAERRVAEDDPKPYVATLGPCDLVHIPNCPDPSVTVVVGSKPA